MENGGNGQDKMDLAAAEAMARAQAAQEAQGPDQDIVKFNVHDETPDGFTLKIGMKLSGSKVTRIEPAQDPIFKVTFCCFLENGLKRSFPAGNVRWFDLKDREKKAIASVASIVDPAGTPVTP